MEPPNANPQPTESPTTEGINVNTCDFETDLCGWTAEEDSIGEFNWMRTNVAQLADTDVHPASDSDGSAEGIGLK